MKYIFQKKIHINGFVLLSSTSTKTTEAALNPKTASVFNHNTNLFYYFFYLLPDLTFNF